MTSAPRICQTLVPPAPRKSKLDGDVIEAEQNCDLKDESIRARQARLVTLERIMGANPLETEFILREPKGLRIGKANLLTDIDDVSPPGRKMNRL